LPLTPIAGGRYTFSMPNRTVIVGATFTPISQFPFTITAGTPANGTFTVTPPGPAILGTRIVLRPAPSDDFMFGNWTITPDTVDINEDEDVPGDFYFLMPAESVTVNAIFVADPRPSITAGTITMVAPVVGATAPDVDTDANVTAGNFTAVLTSIDGPGMLLPSGIDPEEGPYGPFTFQRRSVYTYVFTLTPAEGYRFVSTTTITANASGTNLPADAVDFDFTVGDATATVRVTLPRTIARPGDPTAVDLALGRGAYAVGSSNNSFNAAANPARPFEGTSRLLSAPGAVNVWQAHGAPNPHWLSVDLGSVQDLATVVVTWGPGGADLWDGMVAGIVQVSDGEPADWPPEDDEYAHIAWNALGNFTNHGWRTVGTFRNIARGESEPGVFANIDHDPADGAFNTHRADNYWANFIQLEANARGRFIRIRVDYPFVNPGPTNNTSNFGVWTEWPRISALEVYGVRLTVIEDGEVDSPNPNPGSDS
ncbi:MAG: discoidin domain-containing protein, partial [Treponema sp.]|nr:discoidin domain-containing protein [Treponema sp.]